MTSGERYFNLNRLSWSQLCQIRQRWAEPFLRLAKIGQVDNAEQIQTIKDKDWRGANCDSKPMRSDYGLLDIISGCLQTIRYIIGLITRKHGVNKNAQWKKDLRIFQGLLRGGLKIDNQVGECSLGRLSDLYSLVLRKGFTLLAQFSVRLPSSRHWTRPEYLIRKEQ